jgi:WD40 repeat protein
MRRVWHSVRKQKSRKQDEQKRRQLQQQVLLPAIPCSVWISHILPCLDRISQIRLCMTCKEIYQTYEDLGLEVAWPHGKFRIRRPVLAVAFSPKGNVLAIVPSNSRTIAIWNRRRGYDQSLSGHSGIVSDVTFAPKHDVLASCSRTDGTIRLWRPDESNGNKEYLCSQILNIRVFALRYIRFSPCSNHIASWGHNGTIRLNSANDASFIGSTHWRHQLGVACYDCVAFSSWR